MLVKETALYDLRVRAGAVEPGRTLQLSNCEGPLGEPIEVRQVAEWGQFATLSAGKIPLTAGLQVIRLSVAAQDFLDVDSLRFELASEHDDPLAKADFVVAPDGDDDNTGTGAQPFKTLARARDAVRAINNNMGDDIHVIIRGGTYRLTTPVRFTPEDSASNGFRIFYKAYPGETPVFSGAVAITDWSRHDDRLFKATLNRSSKLRNLYVNDRRALMTSKRITSLGHLRGHGRSSRLGLVFRQ